ncbi:MAG: mannose-1-phosphate guanylyltransferase [Prolixibacteraceae bacterium]|jgi:mannose-1-phosphate guanylyltransferase|nr:mannose-1-phosphate guanylyltransferase [Prolixibacteraceae bacterium]
MSRNYCLIMAGGSGTRFWPRSRVSKPKQYLNIFGDQSLIQETVKRFSKFLPEERIYIISAKSQQDVLEEQITNLLHRNLIYEPVGKNTLPAIGLAALVIAEKDTEGILIVSPSDHLIDNEKLFKETIESAALVAGKTDGIVTIGITPKYPATGYGYVQTSEEVKLGQLIKSYSVRQFVEKPNVEVATGYLQQGGFYWNSGIFVFKVSVFLDSVKKYAPELYASLEEIKAYIGTEQFETALDKIYRDVASISIDYGILEKAQNVFLVQGDFVWNDLGSWEEVYKFSQKDKNLNALSGKVIAQETKNSFVHAQDSLVAVVGLEDVIVVQEGNTILVCKRDQAENIKQVVSEITKLELGQYL